MSPAVTPIARCIGWLLALAAVWAVGVVIAYFGKMLWAWARRK